MSSRCMTPSELPSILEVCGDWPWLSLFFSFSVNQNPLTFWSVIPLHLLLTRLTCVKNPARVLWSAFVRPSLTPVRRPPQTPRTSLWRRIDAFCEKFIWKYVQRSSHKHGLKTGVGSHDWDFVRDSCHSDEPSCGLQGKNLSISLRIFQRNSVEFYDDK